MKRGQLKSDPAITVLVITVGFLVVYAITRADGWLYASLIIGIAGILSGFLRKKIDWVWMKLTWILSLIVPNILLTIVFFVFLTPIALLSRLFGKKDQLSLKNTSASLFKDKGSPYTKESFEKSW